MQLINLLADGGPRWFHRNIHGRFVLLAHLGGSSERLMMMMMMMMMMKMLHIICVLFLEYTLPNMSKQV